MLVLGNGASAGLFTFYPSLAICCLLGCRVLVATIKVLAGSLLEQFLDSVGAWYHIPSQFDVAADSDALGILTLSTWLRRVHVFSRAHSASVHLADATIYLCVYGKRL